MDGIAPTKTNVQYSRATVSGTLLWARPSCSTSELRSTPSSLWRTRLRAPVCAAGRCLQSQSRSDLRIQSAAGTCATDTSGRRVQIDDGVCYERKGLDIMCDCNYEKRKVFGFRDDAFSTGQCYRLDTGAKLLIRSVASGILIQVHFYIPVHCARVLCLGWGVAHV